MNLPEDKPKQTKLLLIGESGNGKSSVGNFILKKNVFEVSSSPNSQTRDAVRENGKGERSDLIVIDTPSLQESKEFNEKFLNDIVDIVQEQEGINGIVIVLNYNTNRISNNIKIMIEIMSKIFSSQDFLKHICIVWNKCYYYISDRQLTNQKEIKRNEFIPELLRRTEILTGAEETIDIPMYYVDSQPDKRCDNIRSENEIERLIEWGRGVTPINIDTSNQEKTPVIEEKEETESMGNNDKQIITQVKRKRREIKIELNGEIKYGDWKLIKVMSNEKQSSNPLKTVAVIGTIIIGTIAIGTIIFVLAKVK
ncbi:AIG1 family protein [Entamoeba histolytica HM-1:IMSS]|uniref:AIG1 family protein n=1 Tax=Entamoeba histolytica (strain ATCC 30459 / HM-1:IMSS / ABRM) TaxID=294381 RepID=C4MBM7_ENTH1|nr:AIG1 family protein [Entamoeba histolytica HM-1:IMSS]EAL43820.2 AIG1 family protein [Entamoeba histolytica HM-1:IMSS]|eukprot:XP_649206.2 AIG1 family protein [Entamoeba histolytica HM-1:IMSS]